MRRVFIPKNATVPAAVVASCNSLGLGYSLSAIFKGLVTVFPKAWAFSCSKEFLPHTPATRGREALVIRVNCTVGALDLEKTRKVPVYKDVELGDLLLSKVSAGKRDRFRIYVSGVLVPTSAGQRSPVEPRALKRLAAGAGVKPLPPATPTPPATAGSRWAVTATAAHSRFPLPVTAKAVVDARSTAEAYGLASQGMYRHFPPAAGWVHESLAVVPAPSPVVWTVPADVTPYPLT